MHCGLKKAILASCAHSSQSEAAVNSSSTTWGLWQMLLYFCRPTGLETSLDTAASRWHSYAHLSVCAHTQVQVCMYVSMSASLYVCVHVKRTHTSEARGQPWVSFLARELQKFAFSTSLAMWLQGHSLHQLFSCKWVLGIELRMLCLSNECLAEWGIFSTLEAFRMLRQEDLKF